MLLEKRRVYANSRCERESLARASVEVRMYGRVSEHIGSGEL